MIGLGMATDADTVLHFKMDELSGPYIDAVSGFNCAAYGLSNETWGEGKARPFVGSNYGLSPVIPEVVRAAFCGTFTTEVVALVSRPATNVGLFEAAGGSGDGDPAKNFIGRGQFATDGRVYTFWEWDNGIPQTETYHAVSTPWYQWIHLGIVHEDAGTGLIRERVFLNGEQVAEGAPVHPPSGGQSARLWIGRLQDGYGVTGLIAEMRFSRVARSAAEILESYERTVLEFIKDPDPPEDPDPPPREPLADPRVSHELGLTGGRLDTDEGLGVAVMCSLFSDARIDEAEARVRGIDDRGGYWADAFSASGPWGSTIWALARAGVSAETARRVEQRARAALKWLLDARYAVSVESEGVAVHAGLDSRIELHIAIRRRAAAPAEVWKTVYVI